ncbi:MAG TPA: hypothetical protein VHW67_01575 [Solirubrobacteraceae bacterium]|nr:hypothetical protein [Solirubrobacteraceae bacterium]
MPPTPSTPPAPAAPATPPPVHDDGRWDWLPPRLRPRETEITGTGRRRRIETAVLLIVGLLLAIATVNDVVLGTHVNHRLGADLRTWRAYTGHDYKNVSTEEDVKNFTTTDFVCANTTPGPPKERTQLCLLVTGPVVHGYRKARGGWYLPPKHEDLRRYRYGCFGTAKTEGACPQ